MNGDEDRQALLDCLAILTAQRGYCPTISEVARCAGMPTMTAYHQFILLRNAGAVDWQATARTLHLTDAGKARLSKVVVL